VKLRTAVGLLIFNRPEHTRQVIRRIALANPPRLLIAADGPRNPGEASLCEETRSAATSGIDWSCDVKTDFSGTNLGCGIRESSAFDWIFSEEEEAILLEDDTVPSASFFGYCQELLERYRDDTRVMHITGANYQQGQRRTAHSYYFSRHPAGWGWASWRRAWRHYDFAMKRWPEFLAEGHFDRLFPEKREAEYWRSVMSRMHRDPREIDTWDYQWFFACWSHNGLTIAPSVLLRADQVIE
jgi:hypothetical protein